MPPSPSELTALREMISEYGPREIATALASIAADNAAACRKGQHPAAADRQVAIQAVWVCAANKLLYP